MDLHVNVLGNYSKWLVSSKYYSDMSILSDSIIIKESSDVQVYMFFGWLLNSLLVNLFVNGYLIYFVILK